MPIPRCPYCESKNECEHLLLRVDRTFLEAEEGALLEAFNERWTEVYNPEIEGFDEISVFQGLMDQVEALTDSSLGYVVEGPPGMSPFCKAYFCLSKDRVASALTKFRTAD